MNLFVWVLQILLALHTVMGAVWKFSNSEQMVPSLKAIPHEAWLAMSVVEVVCALCLILPALRKRMAKLAPLGAAGIAAEMLLFTALTIFSAEPDYGHVTYWLAVVAVCAFVAYGRLVWKPLGQTAA